MNERTFPLRKPPDQLFSPLVWVGSVLLIAVFFPLIMLMMSASIDSLLGLAVFGGVWLACMLSGLLYMAFVSRRTQKAHIRLEEEAIVVAGRRWIGEFRVSLADIEAITQTTAPLRMRWQAVWPPDDLTIFDILDGSAPATQIRLRRRIALPLGSRSWWPLGRCRAVVIDPEEPASFAKAVRELAPHVTIDPSLVE